MLGDSDDDDPEGMAHLAVLRSVGVLTGPDERDGPPTVTDGFGRIRDIRTLGPMPTVGDVSFAGRLGRHVAERRRGVALTFARRTLAVADAERTAPDAQLPDLATADASIAGVDRAPGSDGPLGADRPARVFATPRRPNADATGEPAEREAAAQPASDWPPTRTDPNGAEAPTPDSSGRRHDDTTSTDETESDPGVDPTRQGDDRPTAGRQPRRPGETDSSRQSAPADPSRAPADTTDPGDRTGAERRRAPTDEVGIDEATRASSTASPPTARSSPDHTTVGGDHATSEGSDASAFTRRLDRLTGGADAGTPFTSSSATENDDALRPVSTDSAAGSTVQPPSRRGERREGDVAVESSVEASATHEATRRESAGRESTGRPGSSERVASLHDVSVLRSAPSDAVQRTPATGAASTSPTQPVERARGPGEPGPASSPGATRTRESGVDRRGRWNPTFRRQPSPPAPEATEHPAAAGPSMRRSDVDLPTVSEPTDEASAGVPTEDESRVSTEDENGVPTEDHAGVSTRSPPPTESRTSATPVDRRGSDGVDPSGGTPGLDDPGVARRVGWQPARGRTASVAPRRASASRPDTTVGSGRPDAVRTVVDRSRTPGAVDRPVSTQNRSSAGVDDRPGVSPGEDDSDVPTDRPESSVSADPTTPVEPTAPAGQTTPVEPTGLPPTVPPGTERAERGGRVERNGPDPVVDEGSTALERVVADRSFVRPGSEPTGRAGTTSATEARASSTTTTVTRVDWPLGRATTERRDASVDRSSLQGTGRRAPVERAARGVSTTDTVSAAGDPTAWQPRRFPDRTLARHHQPGQPGDTAATRPPADVDPAGSEPGPAWPETARTDASPTDPTRTGATPTADATRTDVTPTDATSIADTARTDAPPTDRPAPAGEPAGAPGASTPGVAPPSRDRDGATGDAGPAGVRGDSPVRHGTPRPNRAPATSVGRPASGSVARDPRVAVRGPETAAGTPASGSPGRGTDGHTTGEGRPSQRFGPPPRRPLTHRRRRRGGRDRARAGTGTGPPETSPSTPGGERAGDGPPGGTPTTDRPAGTPVDERSVWRESDSESGGVPDTTPGPVTFPADGRPDAGGVPDADGVPGSSAGEAPGTAAGGPGSSPPINRSGRDTHVGTTRIGSLTEMPTLTHQTDRISRPGADTERAEAARPTEPGPMGDAATDDWPATVGSSGSTGATGAGPQRDGTVGGSTGRREGSRRSGAGRRLAARAESTTPTANGRAGPERGGDRRGVPGSEPTTGPPGSEPAADSPGVRDAGLDPYPDLDIRRPAPRVDATAGETQSGPRYERRPGDGGQGARQASDGVRPTGGGVERAVEEALFREGSDLSAHNAELDRVVDRLYRQVERRMEIERERRGL